MIYAFFCSIIIFDQNIFSFCLDKHDYPGSIVYLSCSYYFSVIYYRPIIYVFNRKQERLCKFRQQKRKTRLVIIRIWTFLSPLLWDRSKISNAVNDFCIRDFSPESASFHWTSVCSKTCNVFFLLIWRPWMFFGY